MTNPEIQAARIAAIEAAVAALTTEQLKEYQGTTDGLIWIETKVLDPIDVPRRLATKAESLILDRCEALGIKWEHRA